MIHFDYPDEEAQLKETSIVEDKRFFPDDRNNRQEGTIQFLISELASEGWLQGANVGLEYWSFVPSRAVSEMVESAMRTAGAKNVTDGSFVVRHIRRIKSPQEIAYIEDAVELADLGLRAAEAIARPGVMECEVFGEAIHAMCAAGGEIQGINQGFNVRGLSHGYSGRNRIRSGDVGWFDLCGVVNRYHGNLCRSIYFREPDKKTLEAFAISAEAFDIVKEIVRPGTEVQVLSAALKKHFKPIDSQVQYYFIGGYELGIAFPPDWVGEWTFDAIGGVAPGVFEAGMVTNFESIFYFEDELGTTRDTSNINTIVYGEDETRVLGPYSPKPTVIT
jgi:Xaa-Pro aminopeptidase